MKKIKTEGNQAFSIPNTEEGQFVYKKMKEYKNKGFHFDANGRGNNRKKRGGSQLHVPIHNSEWFAVYMKHEDWIQKYEAEHLRAEAKNWKIIADQRAKEIDNLQATNMEFEHMIRSRNESIKLMAKEMWELKRKLKLGWFKRLLLYILGKDSLKDWTA